MTDSQGEILAESDSALVSCGKVIGKVEVGGVTYEIRCEKQPGHLSAGDGECIGSSYWLE